MSGKYKKIFSPNTCASRKTGVIFLCCGETRGEGSMAASKMSRTTEAPCANDGTNARGLTKFNFRGLKMATEILHYAYVSYKHGSSMTVAYNPHSLYILNLSLQGLVFVCADALTVYRKILLPINILLHSVLHPSARKSPMDLRTSLQKTRRRSEAFLMDFIGVVCFSPHSGACCANPF